MLGSRAVTFSRSSSTLKWPLCEKKVSTITSRCRVALRPRAAIQAASLSRAAAADVLRGTARFILKLILNLDFRRSAEEKQPPLPAAFFRHLAPLFCGHAGVGAGDPHQRIVRAAADGGVGVVEMLDQLRGVPRALRPVSRELGGDRP